MSIYNHRPIPNKKIGNNPQEMLLQQFQKQDVETVPKQELSNVLSMFIDARRAKLLYSKCITYQMKVNYIF